ncbi:sphingomyelin phosphodiesterase A-like isoform X2 [Dysidea avara]|uniref:sphingomyelin phosphodiesterase A-like isoform X2 n=1 Tax=Dysidea avara TaxID=196820 RepID=UPI003329E50B
MMKCACIMFSLWLVLVASISPVIPVPVSPIDLYTADQCQMCLGTVKLLQDATDSKATLADLEPVLIESCSLILSRMEMKGKVLCPGLVAAYGPVIQFVFSKRVIDPTAVCATVHMCSDDSVNITDDHLIVLQKWIDKMLPDDGSHDQPDPDVLDKHTQLPCSSSYKPVVKNEHQKITSDGTNNTFLKILQISDLHVDRLYKEGTPTNCGLFICCRAGEEFSGTGFAGKYGDYNCDIPLITVDLLISEIKTMEPQPDIILYIGDNPPHDVWMETWNGQLQASEYLVDYFSEQLPDTTIYPVFGNHESYPQSQYYADLYMNLTFNMSEIWKDWFDVSSEQQETIGIGGYYTTLLNSKLRLVSLNTDYGYALNFYTMLNGQNIYYHKYIKWIYDTLDEAESRGEKVLLAGHIPPGDTTSLPELGQLYLNITKTYQNTIVAVLAGHTHFDQFELVQDKDGVYGVVLVSPSVTTFSHVNPSYRVYTMDPVTFQLLDYDQYYLDLTEANKSPHVIPTWKKSYSAREEYGLDDLTPNSWAGLVKRFYKDKTMVLKYQQNLQVQSINVTKCDKECIREVICSTTNCNSLNYYLCRDI